MQRDDPSGSRPGGPAPAGSRGEGAGPGTDGDAVLAALAHRLRARSERQQLLTERLRSGELRPGALADLAELAAAARRGARDGDHILVGDACYHGGVVETRNFPAYSDHAAMNRSLDSLLALRGPDTVTVFGHDPAQWGERPVLRATRA